MRQKYIGKTCPFCQFPLKADSEAAECPSCKVPHHRECWVQNGGCTTFGCRETVYQSVAADRLENSFDEVPGREYTSARGGGVNKQLAAALVITLLAFIGVVFAYINLLSDRSAAIPSDAADVSLQTNSPAVIAALDADYYIDYENGTIPIGDLYIGARVADPSWVWEFRTGNNYFGSGNVKPVTWIVVAKDHYEGLDPHVTLLAEELVGQFPFDDSTDRGSIRGSNHWGESGTGNATHGLRLWLNSIGLQSGKGFYSAFSEGFKRAILTTTVPNKEWKNGNAYNTSDNVFISSTTELGDTDHNRTYPIGTAYAFFQGANDAKRVTRLDTGSHLYWTRSPISVCGYGVRYVSSTGEFYYFYAINDDYGVRPVLNLKSEILVSEINH